MIVSSEPLIGAPFRRNLESVFKMSDHGDRADNGTEEALTDAKTVRRVRITHSLWKELRITAAKHDTTPAELLREGARYVVFGIEPRHGGRARAR